MTLQFPDPAHDSTRAKPFIVGDRHNPKLPDRVEPDKKEVKPK